MTEVYFVRHAESDNNIHDDITRPLTGKGMQDRALVTQFFSLKRIDFICSSPYKRAIDTVTDLAQKNNAEIQRLDAFKERCISSAWIEDFSEFSKMQWDDFRYKLSDGESLQEVQNRNIIALKDILNAHQNKTIVIATHGTALSTVINYYDPSFGYDDFKAIVKLMPWIVQFSFDHNVCKKIDKINVFAQ